MTPLLLLVHGWGFDASFFSPLIEALSEFDAVTWDLGFTGAPRCPPPPVGREVIAVGHSFGLLWLLHEKPLAWRALVGINGFARFTATADFPCGVAPRLLDRMADRLDEAPIRIHGEFLDRCGLTASDRHFHSETLDAKVLAAGLAAMRDWDSRAEAHRVDLALAGRSDPIVAPAMTQASFPGERLAWHDGGHLLPWTAPAWCAGRIRFLIESRA